MGGGMTLSSGPVVLASVAVSLDPQPNMGIAVHVQALPVLGDRITLATTCPMGAFVAALDATQAQMLIDDLTKGIAALGRIEAGSPSGAVQ